MRICHLFWATLLVIALSTDTVLTQDDCNGFTSRLTMDHLGRVTPGPANIVRAAPSLDSAPIGRLQAGDHFAISDGPVCADGYLWWQVATQDFTGFTVEGSGDDYWLESIPADDLDAILAVFAFDFTPVADNITAQIAPENTTGNFAYNPLPAHIHVELEAPIIAEFLTPQIDIYPIDRFQTLNPGLYESIQTFMTALRDSPDSDLTGMFLPDILVNAGRIYQSHQQIFEFNGGIGVRYLAQYAQYAAPINGSELFYTFQGITNNGAYYLSVILPLDSVALRTFTARYEGEKVRNNGVAPDYDAALREFAQNLEDGDFSPTLSILDEVVRSMRLDGLAPMPDPVISRYDPDTIRLDYSPTAASLDTEILESDNQFEIWFGLDQGTSVIVLRSIPQEIYSWYDSLWDLQHILNHRPTAPDAIPFSIAYERYQPLGNVAFIESDQLVGVRFLAFRSGPVTNPINYIFRGLSKDGLYSIYTTITLNTPLLPNDLDQLDEETRARATSEDEAIYATYLEGIGGLIDGATSTDFVPCLAAIDAVIQTMTFDGTIPVIPEGLCGS